MRLSLTKDIQAERRRGRAELDGIYGPRLAGLIPSTLQALKASEASRVLAGESSSLIESEAVMRGISPADLAAMIRDKAHAANLDLGSVEANRQAAQIQIDAATSAVEIDDILMMQGGDDGVL